MTTIRNSAAAAFVLAAGLAGVAQAGGYKAEVVRTTYGIPHVTAADYGGLGYGQAYAYAQDNVCLIADKVVTVTGERSRHFGPEATNVVAFAEVKNLESDFFFKSAIDVPALRIGFTRASKDYRDLVAGYVAGYNRYLRDTPRDKLPEPCRGKDWVRPITLNDMLRLNEERMIQASGGAWLRQTNAAAPPTAQRPKPMAALGLPEGAETFGLGSNGWAFGREATANRSVCCWAIPTSPGRPPTASTNCT